MRVGKIEKQNGGREKQNLVMVWFPKYISHSLKNVIMSELLVPSVTVFNQYCDIYLP